MPNRVWLWDQARKPMTVVLNTDYNCEYSSIYHDLKYIMLCTYRYYYNNKTLKLKKKN